MARGAPKFTWKKNISSDLSKLGLDRQSAKKTAQDRRKWRV